MVLIIVTFIVSIKNFFFVNKTDITPLTSSTSSVPTSVRLPITSIEPVPLSERGTRTTFFISAQDKHPKVPLSESGTTTNFFIEFFDYVSGCCSTLSNSVFGTGSTGSMPVVMNNAGVPVSDVIMSPAAIPQGPSIPVSDVILSPAAIPQGPSIPVSDVIMSPAAIPQGPSIPVLSKAARPVFEGCLTPEYNRIRPNAHRDLDFWASKNRYYIDYIERKLSSNSVTQVSDSILKRKSDALKLHDDILSELGRLRDKKLYGEKVRMEVVEGLMDSMGKCSDPAKKLDIQAQIDVIKMGLEYYRGVINPVIRRLEKIEQETLLELVPLEKLQKATNLYKIPSLRKRYFSDKGSYKDKKLDPEVYSGFDVDLWSNDVLIFGCCFCIIFFLFFMFYFLYLYRKKFKILYLIMRCYF